MVGKCAHLTLRDMQHLGGSKPMKSQPIINPPSAAALIQRPSWRQNGTAGRIITRTHNVGSEQLGHGTLLLGHVKIAENQGRPPARVSRREDIL